MTTNMILIRINRTWQEDMGDLALYESTRAFWRVDESKVNDLATWPYAAAVKDGKILEVYKIEKWVLGADINIIMRVPSVEDKKRWAFIGSIAPAEIRNKYRGFSVKSYLSGKGNANPIRYCVLP